MREVKWTRVDIIRKKKTQRQSERERVSKWLVFPDQHYVYPNQQNEKHKTSEAILKAIKSNENQKTHTSSTENREKRIFWENSLKIETVRSNQKKNKEKVSKLEKFWMIGKQKRSEGN